MEHVFETVFSTIVNGVRLQHFNRDSIIDSGYIQFTLEHSDFVDYVVSGQSVQYSDYNYQTLVLGAMNWLSNLSQSDQQIDISKDWSITLQISRMNELPRGFGKHKRNFGLSSMVEATVRDESGDKEFGSSSPNDKGVFNPDMVICTQNQTNSLMNEQPKNDNQASCSMKERPENDDEKYRLFGTPSTHSSDDDDDDDDKFDDDNGTCFKPLFNVDALNFFVNNELNNSAKIKDYFEDGIFSNTALEMSVY